MILLRKMIVVSFLTSGNLSIKVSKKSLSPTVVTLSIVTSIKEVMFSGPFICLSFSSFCVCSQS